MLQVVLLRFNTKNVQEYYPKRRPASEFRHVRLLHDDSPSDTSELMKQF